MVLKTRLFDAADVLGDDARIAAYLEESVCRRRPGPSCLGDRGCGPGAQYDGHRARNRVDPRNPQQGLFAGRQPEALHLVSRRQGAGFSAVDPAAGDTTYVRGRTSAACSWGS